MWCLACLPAASLSLLPSLQESESLLLLIVSEITLAAFWVPALTSYGGLWLGIVSQISPSSFKTVLCQRILITEQKWNYSQQKMLICIVLALVPEKLEWVMQTVSVAGSKRLSVLQALWYRLVRFWGGKVEFGTNAFKNSASGVVCTVCLTKQWQMKSQNGQAWGPQSFELAFVSMFFSVPCKN